MRSKEPKKKLEKDIQREICEWLRGLGVFFWRSNNVPVFSRNNGGKMAFRSLPKDTPRGLPDIMIVYKGKFIGLEVKMPGGKIRPEQTELGKKMIENGAKYYVVYSLDDVVSIFFPHRPIDVRIKIPYKEFWQMDREI